MRKRNNGRISATNKNSAIITIHGDSKKYTREELKYFTQIRLLQIAKSFTEGGSIGRTSPISDNPRSAVGYQRLSFLPPSPVRPGPKPIKNPNPKTKTSSFTKQGRIRSVKLTMTTPKNDIINFILDKQ